MDRREFLTTTAIASAAIMSSDFWLNCLSTNMEAQEMSSNKIRMRYWQYDLKLKHTWTLARGARDIATVTFVELECDGIKGIGEAALSTSSRYGETKETVSQFLSNVNLAQFGDPFQIEDIMNYVRGVAPGNYAAKAAIDIALHDWVGKKLGVPLYKLWGLNKEKTPVTTFSISIDTPEAMMRKTLEAEEFPVLKIKVGKENDKENISAVRKVTGKPLRVDANEGWTSKELALERILWLETQGVEFIEQPMPASQLDDIAWLRGKVHIPIIADESVKGLTDLPKLKDAFDGVNIKLMKCGGLSEAIKMIHTARALGMKIMMGCMIESSVAISAAAQLSPLIDYADLDGNLLVSNDPYSGTNVVKGKLLLTDDPGIGVKANTQNVEKNG